MTYKEAKDKILEALRNIEGWTVKDHSSKFIKMKVPWVKHEDRKFKVWFKSQSIYTGQDKPIHSSHLDMKKIASCSNEDISKILKYYT